MLFLVPFLESSRYWEIVATAALAARRTMRNTTLNDDSRCGRFLGQPIATSTVLRVLAARDDEFSLSADSSPLVLALVGPSGVGKTELAKRVCIASLLLGFQYLRSFYVASDSLLDPWRCPTRP